MHLKKLTPYILILPSVLLILILLIGVINSLLQSFGYIPGLGLYEFSLDYYSEILSRPDFLDSLKLSVYTAVVSSVLSAVIGVMICAALLSVKKWKGLLLKILRIPILIPHTIAALFVMIIFSQSGLLSRLGSSFGIIQSITEFPNLIYNNYGTGVITGYVWKQAPFVAYFTLSVMESISKTLAETAVNLGVSKIKAFFHVTLPLSLPSIANSFLIILAFSFGSYELPFLLGTTKPKALPVQAYIEYTHPDLSHRPYAMAANGIMIVIVLMTALLYFLLFQNKIRSLKTKYEK